MGVSVTFAAGEARAACPSPPPPTPSRGPSAACAAPVSCPPQAEARPACPVWPTVVAPRFAAQAGPQRGSRKPGGLLRCGDAARIVTAASLRGAAGAELRPVCVWGVMVGRALGCAQRGLPLPLSPATIYLGIAVAGKPWSGHRRHAFALSAGALGLGLWGRAGDPLCEKCPPVPSRPPRLPEALESPSQACGPAPREGGGGVGAFKASLFRHLIGAREGFDGTSGAFGARTRPPCGGARPTVPSTFVWAEW